MMTVRVVVASVALAFLASACGSDDESTGSKESAASSADDGTEATGDDASSDEPGTEQGSADPAEADASGSDVAGGSNGGSLTLGSEVVAFESARCFLQEQDAAAGGGKILFVAQAFGTNAQGDELVIDVSRYDEDSQFAGDDITVDIGDPFSEDAVSLFARGPIGTVLVDGSIVSANDLTFVNSDDLSEQTGSIEINC